MVQAPCGIGALFTAIALVCGLVGCGSATGTNKSQSTETMSKSRSTGTVKKSQSTGPAKKSQSTRTMKLHCFGAPGACGYPDPAHGTAGARSACASLPSSGSITTSRDGQTISNLSVTGTITVQNPRVTINNVCVTADGGARIGSAAISLQGAASNTLIQYVTVAGANRSDHSVEQAVVNENGGAATLSHAYLHACGECIHDSWTANDSYIVSDGMQGTSDHVEDVYYDSPGGGSFNHDVLLNPWPQTAVIFGDNTRGGPCASQLTLTHSLIAGGALPLWSCGGMKSSTVGSSTINISGNAWARCTTKPFYKNPTTGGTSCRGNAGTAIAAGADSHGYWPLVGYQWPTNLQFCPPISRQTFENNWYDDTGQPLKCANPYGPQKR